jgi:hypothetical protein
MQNVRISVAIQCPIAPHSHVLLVTSTKIDMRSVLVTHKSVTKTIATIAVTISSAAVRMSALGIMACTWKSGLKTSQTLFFGIVNAVLMIQVSSMQYLDRATRSAANTLAIVAPTNVDTGGM